MIWNLLLEFWPVILGVAGVIAAYFTGGSRQKHKSRADQAEKDFEAIKNREAIEDELERLSYTERRRRLAKWVREGK